MKSITDSGAGSPIATYDYIGGRTLVRTMQNGINLDLRSGSGATYHNELGRPTQWPHLDTNTGGDPVAIGFAHAYDYVGNKLSQDSLHDSQDGQLFAYDSANRLTAFVRGELDDEYCEAPTTAPLTSMTQGRTWELDGLGNWDQTETKVADAFTTDTASNTSFNEYYSFAGTSQTHDANGNLTSGTLNKYKWDGFNRLREVYDKDDNLIVTYLYDADNRRIRKDMASGTDTDYYYEGWQIIEERDNASTAPTRQFVYGIFIDEPLVMDVNGDNDAYTTGVADSRYFYHQNTLYSVYGLSDASGNIVEAYEYDPYGKHWVIYNSGSALTFTASDTRTTQGLSNFSNPYYFTGRRFDDESKLQYSRRRYYDSILGRFISRDPISYDAGPNLYEYVLDAPTRLIDPLGLQGAGMWAENQLWEETYGVQDPQPEPVNSENLGPNWWLRLCYDWDPINKERPLGHHAWVEWKTCVDLDSRGYYPNLDAAGEDTIYLREVVPDKWDKFNNPGLYCPISVSGPDIIREYRYEYEKDCIEYDLLPLEKANHTHEVLIVEGGVLVGAGMLLGAEYHTEQRYSYTFKYGKHMNKGCGKFYSKAAVIDCIIACYDYHATKAWIIKTHNCRDVALNCLTSCCVEPAPQR